MKRFILSVILLGGAFFSFAQNSNIDRANEYLSDRGEVFFSFEIPYGKSPMAIAGNLSVEKITGNTVFAFANQSEFNEFLEFGIEFKIVEEYYAPRSITMANTVAEMANWDRYPTYTVYQQMLDGFVADYPNLCKVYNIGATASGQRNLFFAKVTSNVNAHKQKPQFMYTSTMHGDETTGYVLLLRLIDYLLSNYGTNDEVTYLLDNLEIWICPNENPDGTYRSNNSNLTNARRSNDNGIDLNRNYPCPRPNPPTPIQTPVQAETQAMMNFTDTMNFVMSANMHGGIELVNFPWDAWTSAENRHPDHSWYYLVSREYADTAQFFSPSWYFTDYNGVTHGADWYYAFGSRQDFMNYFRRSREVTLELSSTKLLPSAQLPAYWNYNYRAFINYMKQSLYGIHGTVKDINTNQPLAARIEVIGHDKDNTDVFSYLPLGKFHRPILAGTYNLKVTANGYPEKTIEAVSVANYQTKNLDILLGTPNTSIAEIDRGVSVNVRPNPVTSTSMIDIGLQNAGDVSVEIININGKTVARVYSGFLQQGNSTINIGSEVSSLSKGFYFLRASIGDGVYTTKFVVL